MLAVKTYPKDYIDACRSRIEEQLVAYKAVVSSVPGSPRTRSALESFEPLFFNNLTLVLDQCFVHRTRAIEGKDGNPLNEVRMLCASILTNGDALCADRTIKYDPEASVLKLRIGEEIRLDEEQFRRLSDAFFSELRHRFT